MRHALDIVIFVRVVKDYIAILIDLALDGAALRLVEAGLAGAQEGVRVGDHHL